MNKSLLIGIALGVTAAAAGGVFAGYRLLDKEPGAVATVQSPQGELVEAAPECVPTEPRDEHRIAGTVVGALVGGAVGRDVGDRDVTTAAGAAAGALAGNQIQKKIQENRAGC